jgi:hydroxyacylglutathione hydrolase
MIIHRVSEPLLSHNCWIVACPHTRQALLVDPLRDPSACIAAASSMQVNVVRVLETHTPSDYVSGVCEVLVRTAAIALLSATEPMPRWYAERADRWRERVQFLSDGDTFQIGDISCGVMASPGHTVGSISVLLTHADSRHRALLAGDALLAGGVGALHPDHGGHMFETLRRICLLPDDVLVLSAHEAGSACGVAVEMFGATNMGVERRYNRLLTAVQRGDDRVVLERLAKLDRPSYFSRIESINQRSRVDLLPQGVTADRLNGDTFLQYLTLPATIVIDTRSWSSFHSDGVVGAVHAPLDRYFISTAGGAVDPDEDIVFIGDIDEAPKIVHALRLLGLDRVRGWISTNDYNRLEAGLVDHTEVEEIGIRRAADLYSRGECEMLDVRTSVEWGRGHIRGAKLVTLSRLAEFVPRLPRERMLVLYCRSGGRSARACSFLARRGFKCATLQGGYWPWFGRGLPVEEEQSAPVSSTVT